MAGQEHDEWLQDRVEQALEHLSRRARPKQQGASSASIKAEEPKRIEVEPEDEENIENDEIDDTP